MSTEIQSLLTEANKVILGKENVIKLLLTSILAEGHVLIEDVPGVGKTTLVKFLAKALGADFSRIQCTSDLLPSDIIGVSIFNRQTSEFHVSKGPIFSQVLLVDELNRAGPKTQSALLQAMEEKFVSIDKEVMNLPRPFIVMATQNPREQVGTYPLPESQLDRFLIKLEMGFPEEEFEMRLLKTENRTIESYSETILSFDQIEELKKKKEQVYLSDYLYQYILDLLHFSRSHSEMRGLSPRAGIDLVRALKSWAVLDGRKECLPDDVQYLSLFVWGHRLSKNEYVTRREERDLVQSLMNSVPVP